MSAMPARRLRAPEDLALTDTIAEVFAALSDEGAKDFANEIVHALLQARADGDLSPINDSINKWYRTLLFVQRKGFLDSWDEDHTEDPTYSPDELRDRLKL